MEHDPVIFLPPEWYPQDGILMTWPHADSDWHDLINEVEACYIQICNEILKNDRLIIFAQDSEHVRCKLAGSNLDNLHTIELPTNDTWTRDHGAITVIDSGLPRLYDFQFNGWGMKFAANHDNQITARSLKSEIWNEKLTCTNLLSFVLEGGSIEVDGCGSLLTTENCLLSLNRNQWLSKTDIELLLKDWFGVSQILWLKSGYLAGDDTDSHIDTLARFCSEKSIAYVQCLDPSDEHYVQLSKMEEELNAFHSVSGEKYTLIPLPMVSPIWDDSGDRLPATYANFLIMNKKVLVPVYGVETDELALRVLRLAFPGKKVLGIDCSVLIRQHGSLHCATMQLPLGTLKNS